MTKKKKKTGKIFYEYNYLIYRWTLSWIGLGQELIMALALVTADDGNICDRSRYFRDLRRWKHSMLVKDSVISGKFASN